MTSLNNYIMNIVIYQNQKNDLNKIVKENINSKKIIKILKE